MRKIGLNVGCGNRTKKSTKTMEWINIDARQREHELDMILDITQEFPFKENSCDYIYAEQFIEHLSWLRGYEFLKNCYKALRRGGKIRLVLPHYKKIFQAYIDGNEGFFKVYKDSLNGDDYNYYFRVYKDPEQILKERKDNPPPEWHTSPRFRDRERLRLRVRYFHHLIEVVHWFTHQFGEHKNLLDYDMLEVNLKTIGFSEVKETKINRRMDSLEPTRVNSSLYLEATK